MSFAFGPSGCCCHHGGCAYFQDSLAGSGGLGSNYTGSGTRTSHGALLTGAGAQVMCTKSRPHGAGPVQASVVASPTADGDVARIYFNGSWIGEAVFGSSSLIRILDASGEIMCEYPASLSVSPTALGICLTPSHSPFDPVMLGSGNSVSFGAGGSSISVYCPYSTSLVGFGSGAQNTAGITFSNFVLSSCGPCGCYQALTKNPSWQVEDMTWTLTSSGIITSDPSHVLPCTDCPRMNASVVVPYVSGSCSSAYFAYSDNQTSCFSIPPGIDDVFAVSAQVTMTRVGCQTTISVLLQYGWAFASYAFSKSITVQDVDLTDLSSVNAAFASAALGGGPGLGLYCQGSPAGLDVVAS